MFLDLLQIRQERLRTPGFLLLMLVAFAFSVAVRYIWVYHFGGQDNFMWNGQLMINTNDGYFFAEGARDIIAGFHQPNDLSPVHRGLSKLTALLYYITPVSFETLILWMPAVFGSLVVVPVMLLGRLLGSDVLGFLAALLSGIAVSYYNRTMVGYYDTDLLMIFLPLMALWGTMHALMHKDTSTFTIAPIFIAIAIYWHPGQLHALTGVAGLALLYTLLFDRKSLANYQFLALMAIGLTTFPVWAKVGAILLLGFALERYKERLSPRQMAYIIGAIVAVYLFFGGFAWLGKFLGSAYIVRFLHAEEMNLSLKYFQVIKTVRETGAIPFETFAYRISGHTVTYIIGMVGYVLLLLRYKIFLLSLPLMALGFFALQGGLRFTIFAVPIVALGLAYVILLVMQHAQKLFQPHVQPYIYYGASIALMSVALQPNVMHANNYKVPTVFNKQEVQILDKLGQIADREDYVLTWWDYGYPIRYYSDVKTLIDGGKHRGSDNFPVSFALTQPQISAANMARLDVEFTELGFVTPCGPSIECMLKAYNIQDPNKFLPALNNPELNRPEPTRNVYFYLPMRMMEIFPTVSVFSNLDLLTGEQKQRPLFLVSKNFKDRGDTIEIARGVVLKKEGGTLQLGEQSTPIKHFVVTEYDQEGNLQKNIQTVNEKSNVSVIFMKNYNQFLVVDDAMYNSSYIQLFVLENHDERVFEPVILNPLAKVYKLKI